MFVIETISLLGGADRHHDLVVKMKFFPGMFVGDLRENLCSRKFPAMRDVMQVSYYL